MLNAAGLAIAIVGITISIDPASSPASSLFLVATAIVWIRGARREMEDLPLEHHHLTRGRSRRRYSAPRRARPAAAAARSSRRRRSSSARCRAPRGCRTVSPSSITTRWRKPPRTIATAACSSDQSGAAKTSSAVRWSATSSVSGILAAAERDQDVALGDDARAHRRRGRSRPRRRRARSAICAAAWRSVWPGPTVSTLVTHPVPHLHLHSPSELVLATIGTSLAMAAATRRSERQRARQRA